MCSGLKLHTGLIKQWTIVSKSLHIPFLSNITQILLALSFSCSVSIDSWPSKFIVFFQAFFKNPHLGRLFTYQSVVHQNHAIKKSQKTSTVYEVFAALVCFHEFLSLSSCRDFFHYSTNFISTRFSLMWNGNGLVLYSRKIFHRIQRQKIMFVAYSFVMFELF